MNPRKLSVVQTDVDALADIVGKVVENKLQDREDKQVKKDQINKTLKRDTMRDEKKKTIKEEKAVKGEKVSDSHTHSCPTCKANLKDTGMNFEVCEGCGDKVVTFKKDQKLLVCSGCGNVVSSSDTKCPNCDSTKAHWS